MSDTTPIPGQTNIFAALAEPIDRVGLACTRVREALEAARKGNHLRHAWYSKMDRLDVEVLLAHAEARLAD